MLQTAEEFSERARATQQGLTLAVCWLHDQQELSPIHI